MTIGSLFYNNRKIIMSSSVSSAKKTPAVLLVQFTSVREIENYAANVY